MRAPLPVNPMPGAVGPARTRSCFRSLWTLVALLALALPRAGFAWPVDVQVELRPGEERFRRLSAVEWVEVEDPAIATAEVMESGELLFTAKSPGKTLLLLYAEGKFAVWRLRVGGGAPPRLDALEPAVAVARKACPGLKAELGGEAPTLEATISDEKCRQALSTLLQQDGFTARNLELTFSMAALQTQLQAIQAGIGAAIHEKVESHYLGAGLILDGKLSARDHRKVLWEIFKHSVGRPAVSDHVELTDAAAAPDAGMARP